MKYHEILAVAHQTWPSARLVTARKAHRCQYQTGSGCCRHDIQRGDKYIDSGDANPDNAGGWGGYRYCLIHFQEVRQ